MRQGVGADKQKGDKSGSPTIFSLFVSAFFKGPLRRSVIFIDPLEFPYLPTVTFRIAIYRSCLVQGR